MRHFQPLFIPLRFFPLYAGAVFRLTKGLAKGKGFHFLKSIKIVAIVYFAVSSDITHSPCHYLV